MNDLEQRVQNLEAKVKLLEDTLETMKQMQLSEQMTGFIQSQSRTLKLVNLVNSVSDKPDLDFHKEEESLRKIQEAKQNVDSQIQEALKEASTFSDAIPSDAVDFDYEVESGMVTYILANKKRKDDALTKFIGKGIRITSFNGFEVEKIIVPHEIDGQPVISIGEKAFMNATITEVILPKTLKIILESAFEGCKNLIHIDLPDGIEYLGYGCFMNSAITKFECPHSLKNIPSHCFDGCSALKHIQFGDQTESVENDAFEDTAIKTLIFPSNVKVVSNEAFGLKLEHDVIYAFLGKETRISGPGFRPFIGVGLIYCLPGSNVQKYAREHGIPIKPLSEFRMEEHT